jgi:hypothetical protein
MVLHAARQVHTIIFSMSTLCATTRKGRFERGRKEGGKDGGKGRRNEDGEAAAKEEADKTAAAEH